MWGKHNNQRLRSKQKNFYKLNFLNFSKVLFKTILIFKTKTKTKTV